ncbi:Protein tyrosine phosphatase SHP1 [Gracilaria domingensis]|nr:Protein tyrosine phosphatase SHP1 [Gracilaria domingensis]
MRQKGATQTAPALTSAGDVDAAGAAAAVAVGESHPVAIIRVHLSDGSRVTARLNEDHTVGDLRRSVTTSRPSATSFTLSTTSPQEVHSNDVKAIKTKQLKDTVVAKSLK